MCVRTFDISTSNVKCWVISKISWSLSLNEAETMKLFTYLRHKYAILGISPVQNAQMQTRNCLQIFFVAQLSITGLVYLIFEAESIPEYVDSFYAFSTAAVNEFCFILVISKAANIFRLIEKLEEAIEQRNEQAIYVKLNEKIELFSQRFNFGYVRCTSIGVVMPILMTTLFGYFTTDAGSDAFQLPFLVS